MNKVELKRFINSPVPSNTYLLSKSTSSCIIIDPGTKDETDILAYVHEKNLRIDYIILTHEHFDHCWGVNHLIESSGAKVVCTRKCAEVVGKPSNYFNKFYFNSEETYSVDRVDIMVEDIGYKMEWEGVELSFIKTKGHSPNSMCISVEGVLFTGDTLLLNTKPVLMKRMGSSKEDLKISIETIFHKFEPETIVYPGHGDSFRLCDAKAYYECFFGSSI